MKFRHLTEKRRVSLIGGALIIISIFILAFSESKEFKLVKNFEIFTSLFRELNLYYVDETDPEKLIKSSIDEMLKTLDPYTVYIPESAVEDFRFTTTGQYGGIGSLIRKSGDYAVMSAIYKGFPADLAGFKTGDLIIEIDGKSIKRLALSKISEKLKGLPDTEVNISVQRYGIEDPISKKMLRKKIQIKSIPYYGMMDGGIGYIRLRNFTQNAGDEVKEALLDLKNNNDLKGLILDLRANPGGLLIEAVKTTNLFIEKGQEIVSTRGKVKDFDHTYVATASPVDTNILVAVLVSRGSASAAEIVAGAFQDLDRGIIIGERTFGKGLVQTTRPLGYNSQLKVTTAKYYIPSGRCIQALDYSNRNEDGSVGYIPDSLISEFTTRNGRNVFDGGGVRPDVMITPEKLSQIAIELYTRFFIFDYATRYALDHDFIVSPEDFALTDEEYKHFIEFIDSKDFDYKTQTEESLNKLEELAKKEKYYTDSKEEFALLKEKLSHDKYKDLISFKDEITQLIEEEIVGRYFYQAGSLKSSLAGDEQIKRAVKILKDPLQYSSILNIKTENVLVEMD